METIDISKIICPYCKTELINEYGTFLQHKPFKLVNCDVCNRLLKVVVSKKIKYSTYLVEKGNHHPSSD